MRSMLLYDSSLAMFYGVSFYLPLRLLCSTPKLVQDEYCAIMHLMFYRTHGRDCFSKFPVINVKFRYWKDDFYIYDDNNDNYLIMCGPQHTHNLCIHNIYNNNKSFNIYFNLYVENSNTSTLIYYWKCMVIFLILTIIFLIT